jgi:hypothetical protein
MLEIFLDMMVDVGLNEVIERIVNRFIKKRGK